MAGKRKSRKPPKKPKIKPLQPLDTQFDCPFCNNENSCTVKMDKSRKSAEIRCSKCEEMFRTNVHNLSEPIDVYNDWIDACEACN